MKHRNIAKTLPFFILTILAALPFVAALPIPFNVTQGFENGLIDGYTTQIGGVQVGTGSHHSGSYAANTFWDGSYNYLCWNFTNDVLGSDISNVTIWVNPQGTTQNLYFQFMYSDGSSDTNTSQPTGGDTWIQMAYTANINAAKYVHSIQMTWYNNNGWADDYTVIWEEESEDDELPTYDVDSVIERMMGYLVPLIVMVLPSFLMGKVFKMGLWGYLIGLAVGSGLGYVFLPQYVPVWLVFIIGLGIVAVFLRGRQ